MATVSHGVEINLGLNNRVSAPLTRIADQFRQVEAGVRRVTSTFSGFATGMLQFTGGMVLYDALRRTIHGVGEELINANAQQQKMQTQIAGMAALVTGMPIEKVAVETNRTWTELENKAIDVGASIDDVTAAYQTLLPVAMAHGASMAETAKLTANMAGAAVGLGMSTGQMAQSAMMFEQGFARSRDPLVMMMRNLGMLGRSGKDLQKILAPDKADERQRLIATAMERMAAASAKLPMTWDRLWNSVTGIKDEFIETMGAPAFASLMSQFKDWRGWLVAHRHELEETAKAWGQRIAEGLGVVITKAREAFTWLTSHWEQIVSGLKAAVALWVANKAWIIGSGIFQMGKGVAGIAGVAARGLGGAGAAAEAMGGAGMSAVGMGALVRNLWKGTGALGGFTQKLGAFYIYAQAAVSTMQAFSGSTRIANEAIEAGFETMSTFEQYIYSLTHAFEIGGTLLGNALRLLSGQELIALGGTAQTTKGERMVNVGNVARSLGMRYGEVEDFARTHGGMSQDQAALERQLVGAGFGTGAHAVALERDIASERLGGTDSDIRRSVEEMAGNAGPTIDARGSTFNIKQDFRDQDPDRIMTIFTRDIARSAEARRMSGWATAYGG